MSSFLLIYVTLNYNFCNLQRKTKNLAKIGPTWSEKRPRRIRRSAFTIATTSIVNVKAVARCRALTKRKAVPKRAKAIKVHIKIQAQTTRVQVVTRVRLNIVIAGELNILL